MIVFEHNTMLSNVSLIYAKRVVVIVCILTWCLIICEVLVTTLPYGPNLNKPYLFINIYLFTFLFLQFFSYVEQNITHNVTVFNYIQRTVLHSACSVWSLMRQIIRYLPVFKLDVGLALTTKIFICIRNISW